MENNNNNGQKRKKTKNRKERIFLRRARGSGKKYLETEDKAERNEIFNTVLKPAFTKMIESIIRRYKLYVPEEEFDDTFKDTLSFLSSKMANFDPSKHHKAYSYYGTICKNYLIYKINQFKKKVERNEQYDDVYEKFQNNINYSEDEENGKTIAEELVNKTVNRIHGMIDDEKSGLSDNEKKVGLALCELFENWEDILCSDGSNKLQKSSVLYFLCEETMMTTKELRDNMAVYKKEYYVLKNLIIG